MKKEVKELWCKALRSGEYKKCKERLKKGAKRCCLGVLTEVYCKEHNMTWDDLVKKEKFTFPNTVLCNTVIDWVELNNNESPFSPIIVYVNPLRLIDSLAGVNDYTSSNFRTIANIIEKQL